VKTRSLSLSKRPETEAGVEGVRRARGLRTTRLFVGGERG
jgi:hypothetical protein